MCKSSNNSFMGIAVFNFFIEPQLFVVQFLFFFLIINELERHYF